jgi:phenylpyruvate tautomerase PptA (4-oxalocrotonate tautomerase family)
MYNSMQDVKAEIINALSRLCVEFGNKNEKNIRARKTRKKENP